jgi:hypothetical protein
MGNCTDKGSRNVAEQRVNMPGDSTSLPSLPPPHASSCADDPHEAAQTLDKNHHRKSKAGGTAGANTTAASTGNSSAAPSLRLHHDVSGTQTPNGKHRHSSAADVTGKEENESCGSPTTLGNTQTPSKGSVAIRLEQGSTYVWLRSTYGNPHLKPVPLLTRQMARELRKHSVAFQHLWSMLGEAACVIGPYATAPSPASLLSPLEDDDNDHRHAHHGDVDFHVEPSFVNDEERVVQKASNDASLATAAAGAAASDARAAVAGGRLLEGVGQAEVEGPEASEVRVLNSQHISIDGDEMQRRPIDCRGAVFRGKHLWIHKLRSRCCFVFESLNRVDLNDCSDALIVLGPTAGAVSLSNCQRCLVVAASAQLRVLSCKSLILSVNVAGFPVIEKSTNIGVAPLVGWYAYSNLPIDFRLSSLSLFTNNYSTVRDVTPPQAATSNNNNINNAASLSLSMSLSKVCGSTAAAAPSSNFVYVDLWELEAAVWKAMAEQRWSQLIAEADKKGTANAGGNAAADTAPKASAPVQSPLAVDHAEEDSGSESDGGELVRGDTLTTTDTAFHSMISFGHFNRSPNSTTYPGGGGNVTTATSSAEDGSLSNLRSGAVRRAVLSSVLAASTTDGAGEVPLLPRWRLSGFNGNTATDGTPLESHKRGSISSSKEAAALMQRGSVRDAEHLVRVVLRAVPLLPLSALRDASTLLLDHDDSDTPAPESHAAPTVAEEAAKKDKDSGATGEKGGTAKNAAAAAASHYNPLELALVTYTHTCAAPSTFGAQLIPVDFFEQGWKLKLMVLTAKGGGYDLARRIARDIEASRRRCFLETVRAMLHAPPPATHDDPQPAMEDTEEEDTFSEALWHYLRTTSLTQRCGAVLLLNMIELRCTETAVREFVAPVFYKLCEPVGQRNSEEGARTAKGNAAAASGSGGGGRGLHLPWKSGSSSSARGSSQTPPDHHQHQQQQQLEHNVEMRRLLGTAIQRMTGQTCIAMLALLAPQNLPQCFQRPPGAGGHSAGGALTPTELDAWTTRAEEARRIFTPQKDTNEADEGHPHQQPVNAGSHDEPTAGGTPSLSCAQDGADNDYDGSSGDAVKEKQHQPTLDPPHDGDAAPPTLEERVWPQAVLLNVTVPLRFVTLLQSTLFFKSQMHTAATAGAQQMREQGFEKKA